MSRLPSPFIHYLSFSQVPRSDSGVFPCLNVIIHVMWHSPLPLTYSFPITPLPLSFAFLFLSRILTFFISFRSTPFSQTPAQYWKFDSRVQPLPHPRWWCHIRENFQVPSTGQEGGCTRGFPIYGALPPSSFSSKSGPLLGICEYNLPPPPGRWDLKKSEEICGKYEGVWGNMRDVWKNIGKIWRNTKKI